jgi:hypothetical protein
MAVWSKGADVAQLLQIGRYVSPIVGHLRRGELQNIFFRSESFCGSQRLSVETR